MRIKQLREEKGLSQQKLADILGDALTQQKINNYENKIYEPDINILMRMAEYFNVSIDYLVGHSDNRQILKETTEYKLTDKESEFIKILRNFPEDLTDKQLEYMKCILNKLGKK